MNYILDEHGEPKEEPNVLAWAQWLEANPAYRQVAADTIAEPVGVSTVFLGIDHQFSDGPPLLFETLISGGRRNGEITRYSTRVEALKGHADTIRQIQGDIR